MVENILITLIRLSVGKRICSQLVQKYLKVSFVGRITKCCWASNKIYSFTVETSEIPTQVLEQKELVMLDCYLRWRAFCLPHRGVHFEIGIQNK